MVDSYSTILRAISSYKLILRRTLSSSQCTSKMHELGIKRQYIRKVDEVGLYKIGLKIKEDLKSHVGVSKDKKSNKSHHGAAEFLQHLEKLLAHYHVENDRVVHVGRKVSCTLVDAIQLITLSKEKLTPDEVQRIMQYGDIIATYGSGEQKKMFVNAVREYQNHLIDDLPKNIFVETNSSLVVEVDYQGGANSLTTKFTC